MKRMRLFLPVLLCCVCFDSAADFPEFPFCPLGGPPGWMNRLFDDGDGPQVRPPPRYYAPYPAHPRYRYPPGYAPRAPFRPELYRGWY